MPTFPVDDAFLRRVAELMKETDLTEVDLTSGRHSIRMRRGTLLPPAPSPAPVEAAPRVEPAAPPPSPQAAPETAEPDAEDLADHPGAVASPMVGTLYVSATQDGPPLIRVGDQVSEGDQIFIIEAMKTMNPVLAPRGGTVTRILVENAMPVEYGALLAVIE